MEVTGEYTKTNQQNEFRIKRKILDNVGENRGSHKLIAVDISIKMNLSYQLQ